MSATGDKNSLAESIHHYLSTKNKFAKLPKSDNRFAYSLVCTRPAWFVDSLRSAEKVCFAAESDAEALYKMQAYFLENGIWKTNNEPLDLIAYALKCPQWELFRRLALPSSSEHAYEKQQEQQEHQQPPEEEAQTDDKDDEDDEDDGPTREEIDRVFNGAIDAVLGLYGIGPLGKKGCADCALAIQKMKIFGTN